MPSTRALFKSAPLEARRPGRRSCDDHCVAFNPASVTLSTFDSTGGEVAARRRNSMLQLRQVATSGRIVGHSENGPTLHSRRLELDYRS